MFIINVAAKTCFHSLWWFYLFFWIWVLRINRRQTTKNKSGVMWHTLEKFDIWKCFEILYMTSDVFYKPNPILNAEQITVERIYSHEKLEVCFYKKICVYLNTLCQILFVFFCAALWFLLFHISKQCRTGSCEESETGLSSCLAFISHKCRTLFLLPDSQVFLNVWLLPSYHHPAGNIQGVCAVVFWFGNNNAYIQLCVYKW